MSTNEEDCNPLDCDEKMKPFIGKCFSNLEEATEFYSNYANEVGFDIRKSSGTKVDNVYTWKLIVCSREGFKKSAEEELMIDDEVVVKKRRRRSSRCGCRAKIQLKFVADIGYVVHEFIAEHNHALVEKVDKRFMRVNRKLDHVHQMFILDCTKAGIGPTHAHKLLAEVLGGHEYVGCTVTEVRNFTRDMKAYVEGSDAQMLLNEMAKKKELCDAFTYDFEVDGDEKLKRLFWCDPISRRNYHFFGDVVAFDTTYSTNKYCMIFAPFTGRDNHGRAVTFAAGLINKEDADSFIWLFEKFVSCMGKAPKLIITDQDLGMKVAVERVLSETRHRWCMWHIMLKLADKVSKDLQGNEVFKKELNSCVWSDLIEPDEFDQIWGGIMTRYELNGEGWFKALFKEKKFWVPAYFRDFPLSGLLRTTSIVESENSFYKRYTKSRSNLLEFFMHFNHALEDQREVNSRLNYNDKCGVPTVKTKTAIEKHAAEVYTAKIFESVQKEIVHSVLNCRLTNMNIGEEKEVYSVIDEVDDMYDVSFDSIDEIYACTCKLFGRMGYICRHIFFVLKNKGIKCIPENYLLERWKKFLLMSSVDGIENDDIMKCSRVDENRRLMNKIMSAVFSTMNCIEGDTDKISRFLSVIDNARESIVGDRKKPTVDERKKMIAGYYGQTTPENIDVLPPDPVKTKGSGSRLVSRKEAEARKASKLLRKCSKCKKMGHHDARNCGKVEEKKK